VDLSDARKLRGLEVENCRVKKTAGELTIDKQTLKNALENNF
jgi:hypothetical protein